MNPPPPPPPPAFIVWDIWMLCVIQASSPWADTTASPRPRVTTRMGIVVPLISACMTCPPRTGVSHRYIPKFTDHSADACIPSVPPRGGRELTGSPARARRARVGLGEAQPVVSIGTAGHETQVVAMAPLGDQQAEIQQRPGDALGGIRGTPHPGPPAGRGELDPELLGRRGETPGEVREVPGPYAQPGHVHDPVGVRSLDAERVADVLAVREQLHQPGGGQAGRSEERRVGKEC